MKSAAQLPSIPAVTLGRSGITATRLGLGFAAWPLKVPYRQVVDMAQTALDGGIRYFDVAPLYHTEELLGRVVRDLGAPDDLVIATKTCSYRDDLGVSYLEYSAATTRASVQRSASRLRRPLDVVHIHDVESENLEQIFADDGALHALVEMRNEGLVRSFGMATWDIDCLLAAVDAGEFDHIQFYHSYTLLNQEATSQLLPRARAKQMSTMNTAPQAGFILASGPVPGAHYNYAPAPPEVMAATGRVQKLCAQKGIAMPEAAIAFSLRNPSIDVTVVGADTPELVRRCVGACDLPLSTTDYDELVAAAGGPFEIARGRPTTAWHAGPWEKLETDGGD